MITNTPEKTKSPIKNEKILRRAGQSLDEEIAKVVDDNVVPYALASAFALMIALMEWIHWATGSPPNPFLYTSIAIIIIGYSAYKLHKVRKVLKNLRQGRDGERSVAQYIDLVRSTGMRIFHDIPGEDFNIDHLIVSKKGLYVIETKTYSKPSKGTAKIFFDGEKLVFNNDGFSTREVIQVTAAAKWIENLIEELTAKRYSAKPVLVFPGWYVEMAKNNKSDVWTLNPKALKQFIDNRQEVFSNEDVKLISANLSRYISDKIK